MSAVTLGGYQLRLAGFDGPLDVLLRMIEERRLEITTLSLVEVTEGFVAHIDRLVDPPPMLLADFVGVAARLLVLKSRALIPQAPAEEADDELEDIALQLEQYRRMRVLSSTLKERDARALRSYARVAAPLRRFVNTTLALPVLDELRGIQARAAARPADQHLPQPFVVQVSIQEMIERIQRRLERQRGPLRFGEAVGSERGTLVAGFVAMLALWARRAIDLTQDGLFEDIVISQRRPHDAKAES